MTSHVLDVFFWKIETETFQETEIICFDERQQPKLFGFSVENENSFIFQPTRLGALREIKN